MVTSFDREVYACTGTAYPYDKDHCRVWDPASQPSVQRELEQDPDAYKDRVWFSIESGSIDIMGTKVPLHTDMLLCSKHAARCIELYGPVKAS